MVSTDYVLKNTNNETVFYELGRVFDEYFEIKSQEGSVLKYLNLRICRFPLSLSVYHTDHIMELVNEWSPTGKFRNVDTPFWTESNNEKELVVALPLTGNVRHKSETKYHGKFGHTIGRIQHISLMITIKTFYTACRIATKTVAPTIPGFQYLKCCIKYLASHPHKPIFYLYNSYDDSNVIILTWIGNKV